MPYRKKHTHPVVNATQINKGHDAQGGNANDGRLPIP